MAMKWNWRKLGFGSGAIVAAISTAFAYKPSSTSDGDKESTGGTHSSHHHFNVNTFIKQGVVVAEAATRDNKEQMLQEAIQKSRKLCKRLKNEKGLPGLTVGVTVNGKMVWQEGFGLANIENGVQMKPEHIIRIASISKSITMAMMAKLMEEGKIDIDKPIQTYLPAFPEKYFEGEKVTITTRHLLSHLSGIRHYMKKADGKKNENDSNNNTDKVAEEESNSKKKAAKVSKNKKEEKDEMDLEEYFLKEKFNSVEESMKLFQDDELFVKPGTKMYYTTHGWTVVSAIIEKLTETEFPKYCQRMFEYWGLKNTKLDQHAPIIYNRTSYYTRHKNGVIVNSPYVDNSYKWAGGGFLSNVGDLTQFANMLLYSMQTPEGSSFNTCEKGLPKIPFLKQSTMKTIWTGNPATEREGRLDFLYAMGFSVGEPLRKCMFCKERELTAVHHDGGAIGASSMLLLVFPPVKVSNACDTNIIKTTEKTNTISKEAEKPDVNGVAVAMITNMTSASLGKVAYEIADYFKEFI